MKISRMKIKEETLRTIQLLFPVAPFLAVKFIRVDIQCEVWLEGKCLRDQWPLLLTWFNLNPSMDKQLHTG